MNNASAQPLGGITYDKVTDWYIPEGKEDQDVIVYPGAVLAVGAIREHADKLREIVVWTSSQTGDDVRDWRLEYKDLTFRCHKQRTVGGSIFILRRISTDLPDLKSLGIQSELVRHLSSASLGEQGGLVLITGMPGHGKSTTAAALIMERVRSFGSYCLTVEDPPEFPMHGNYPTKSGRIGMVVQVPAQSESFAHDLKDALRCYPSNMRGSMLLVGEVRDGDTAGQLLRAAVNGQLVIGTLHASDRTGALERLLALAKGVMDAEEARSLLAHTLRIVLHQKLVNGKLHMEPLLSLRHDSSVAARIKSGQLAQLSSDLQLQDIALQRNNLLSALSSFQSRSAA